MSEQCSFYILNLSSWSTVCSSPRGLHTFLRVHTHTHTHTHIDTHTHHTHTHRHRHTHTQKQTHTHTHIDTHTPHTHTQTIHQRFTSETRDMSYVSARALT